MDLVETYCSGKTIAETAAIVGKAQSTVRYHLLKAGVLRTRSEAMIVAAKNGRMSRIGKRKPLSEAAKKRMSLAKIGKGVGFTLKQNGYIEFTMGENKCRSVHVVAIEKMIGRKLYANECVHHIDHNRSNNDLSNLRLMTRSEHARIHATENSAKRKRTQEGRFTNGKLE